MTATDVDVAAALAEIGRQFGQEPTRVLLVDPEVRDPLAEAYVERRPRPGESVTFAVTGRGTASYVLESHGAWQMRVEPRLYVRPADEVVVHVA